ncbi:hypothetical protein CNR22_10545 [Sphingobacteriaceae bacterium]|nr:hypothetical protein CNR22_10545 [Sphingobacteriaceae bacterium]
MKKSIHYLILISTLLVFSCRKDKKSESESSPETPVVIDNYTSLSDFYLKNGVQKETFTFNAGTGGSFISQQGTTINIAPNTFTPASASVVIEFKDIYKKSDMLLSDMPTQAYDGTILKSAGEFFIKALINNNAVELKSNAKIQILQPLKQALDTGMKPFVILVDTNKTGSGWYNNPGDSVFYTTSNYVYDLYNFSSPASSGTWCNSDNPNYFSSSVQTTLTIHANQTGNLNNIFLVFKDVNSMVHVYKYNQADDYIYNYAPTGLKCTVVALGVKDNKLYSSFTPITISSNQTVSFDLIETTTENFKAALKALD